MKSENSIRNIAIIAHVDHGKTGNGETADGRPSHDNAERNQVSGTGKEGVDGGLAFVLRLTTGTEEQGLTDGVVDGVIDAVFEDLGDSHNAEQRHGDKDGVAGERYHRQQEERRI